eukprot:TRINITY_DN8751_c0_g1_i1.p1 TRINITY_DN8751_c0_g1~~TRINITY_DN8751_c0_g1_i1.p1  ORF type:complete len:287 (-),score=61.28 TRINITY_DN8751_c0_g1_i1:473-1333(-)
MTPPIAHAAVRECYVGDFGCVKIGYAETMKQLEASSSHIFGLALKAIDVVEEAISRYGFESLALSFNAGKDCMVLLHILHLAISKNHPSQQSSLTGQTTISSNECSDLHGPQLQSRDDSLPIFVVYFKTTTDSFAEVLEFMDLVGNRYGFKTRVEEGSMKAGLQNALDHRHFKAIFMGSRRTDPYCGHLEHFSITDSNWPQVMRINPIIDWDYKDIWEFTKALQLPYCRLYELGYTSLGSTKNTVPNPALKQDDGSYLPAHYLQDGSRERDGRLVLVSPEVTRPII